MTAKHYIIKTTKVFAILAILFFASCEDAFRKSKDEEGIIEFDTKGVDVNHPLYGFAPNSATFKFKKKKFAIEMSVMGLFNMTILGDNTSKTMSQSVKFMNVKQACIENEKELLKENLDYKIKIEETSETKDILGMKCYKINVTMLDAPFSKFEAWYTKDLGMEDCNILTPYAQVKGMLLDYRLKKMGMELHFAAKSYSHVEVPDQTFEIPASMKIISKEEMAKFINDLQ
ncbi:MAG: hypothetical protein WCR21_05195 [Bacteroidota bacterium]